MIDIATTAMLLVSVVLAFSGIIFAMLGTTQRQALKNMSAELTAHNERLAYLERRDAVRESEFKQVITKLDHLGMMLENHEERHWHRRRDDQQPPPGSD